MASHRPDSLGSLKASLENYYGKMFATMRQLDDYYRGNFDAAFTDFDYDVPRYNSATPQFIVDTYVNQLRTDEPVVNFIPSGTSKDSQQDAALMKMWGESMMRKERVVAELDPNLQCGFFLCLRGATAKRIVLDVNSIPSKELENYEDSLASYWPFIVRAIDPLSVLPSPGLKRPLSYILEVQGRHAYYMWETYPDWSDPKARKFLDDRNTKEAQNPIRNVEWLEYWSAPLMQDGKIVEPGYYIVEADGERVIEKENPYNFVPYIYEYSGRGIQHVDGDPDYLARGLLHGLDDEIKWEVRLKTAMAVQAMVNVFPTLLTTEDAREAAKKFQVGPARVYQHKPGQEPKFLQPPAPNPNIALLLGEAKQNILRAAPPSLQGIRQPGVDYGVLQSQLTGQGLTTIRHIRATLDKIGTQSLNMMARMMKQFELDMNVQGTLENVEKTRKVNGKDFKHLNFDVHFEASDPAEDRVALMTGLALRRAGEISQRTYWERFAKNVVKDPDQEESNLWLEKVFNYMAQSGILPQVIMTEDNLNQAMAKQQEFMKQAESAIQNRTQESVPEIAQKRAAEYEQTAGTPNITGIPRQIGEEANREFKGS